MELEAYIGSEPLEAQDFISAFEAMKEDTKRGYHIRCISPKAGRTHAPGKSYRPLERFLPPLRARPKQALDKQMRDLRKSRDAGKTTPGTSAPVEAAPAPTPSTSTSQPAPSRSRSALEVELDKYVAIEVENGVIIEDKHGVPLIVLVRHTIPQDKQKEMNVRISFLNILNQSPTPYPARLVQGRQIIHKTFPACKDLNVPGRFPITGHRVHCHGMPLCHLVGYRATGLSHKN